MCDFAFPPHFHDRECDYRCEKWRPFISGVICWLLSAISCPLFLSSSLSPVLLDEQGRLPCKNVGDDASLSVLIDETISCYGYLKWTSRPRRYSALQTSKLHRNRNQQSSREPMTDALFGVTKLSSCWGAIQGNFDVVNRHTLRSWTEWRNRIANLFVRYDMNHRLKANKQVSKMKRGRSRPTSLLTIKCLEWTCPNIITRSVQKYAGCLNCAARVGFRRIRLVSLGSHRPAD